MFNETKNLIVVAKDELLVNLLKKLVETKDDNEKIVGTKDGSITVVAWDEKMWLSQKMAGTVEDKVLFIGNIKGVNKLLPIVEWKFDKWGVKYGWSGKQAVIHVNSDVVISRKKYEAFYEEYSSKSKNEIKNIMKNKVKKQVAINLLLPIVGSGISAGVNVDEQIKIHKQLFMYGIEEFYYNNLETFMNS